MKVMIIEDEPLAVERLKMILAEYDRTIEIVGTADSISSAKAWFAIHPVPDLVFLDIQLADGMSFTIFSETSIKCPVIFTTAYDHYAIDAFRLFSIDYLLKPITLTALAAAMNKYRDMVTLSKQFDISAVLDSLKGAGKNYKERFLVKTGSRMFFIESSDICYFYADDKTVFLIDREGTKFVVDQTLESLQNILDPKHFFRLNRKVISNISAIKEIKTYLNKRLRIFLQAGKNREEVIISRDRVQAFKAWAE
ncbi:MAG: LytTR family DNA-binding domain-containing protein [Chitinophagaceae bacterium]